MSTSATLVRQGKHTDHLDRIISNHTSMSYQHPFES